MRVRPKRSVITLMAIVVVMLILRNQFYSSRTRGHGQEPVISSSQKNLYDGWITPNFYRKGDPLELIVNKIESDLTQLPYAYYDLPFTCPPTMHKKPLHLSLNEIIRGDRKWESDYKLKFGEDNPCETLCARKTTKEGMQTLDKLVREGYVVQWLIDDELPAATTFISTTDHKKYYASGFPLGFIDPDTDKTYLHNHVMLVIRFHASDNDKNTIVGFEVYPRSVSDYHCPGASKNYEQYEIVIPEDENELTYLPFTYSVYWREEFEVDWNHRWDYFLNAGELSDEQSIQFHWMSLANSVGIVLSISFITLIIYVRVMYTDKSNSKSPKYMINIEGIETEDDLDDDKYGKYSVYTVAKDWIQNGRPNLFGLKVLILLVSFGVQFLFTIIGSLTISCSMNKLHNVRNSVLTMAILFFVLGAFMASFVGTRLSMVTKTKRTKANYLDDNRYLKDYKKFSPIFTILCGSSLPGIVMVSTFLLNSIVWAHDSTSALPFKTIVFFISIYFIVCIPLSLFGGIVANNIPLPQYWLSGITKDESNSDGNGLFVPKSRAKFNPLVYCGIYLCGIFPLLVIYVEMQYVYKSLWLEKTTFYYFYGFLFLSIILLCVLTMEISIIGSYLLMRFCFEDKVVRNNWRWKCFEMGFSGGVYMELYSLYYIFAVLNIHGFSSILISICYSLIFNVMCGLGLGALSYLTASWFINKIYHQKVNL
ncbi:BFP_1a_G0015560.mRNA.1.CDS.1 [Saccharomyces cerevisiae]|nr:BFP_1a_G0015560.mRNA.1.CDS.1 [Saccharomyces cerevisiae]CAI7103873.1 BFP_1a_G0015560.mRNA.1.CDS.1 [Saccharomyces cerevisiae]